MRRRDAAAALLGAALGAAGALATAPASAASSPAGPAIRVLIAEGRSSLRIEPLGADGLPTDAPPLAIVRDGARLRRDAAEASDRLRLDDAAAWRVGALRVRGALELYVEERGIAVVNELPLEEYVPASLGAEIYPGWGGEVLRAQAVVARTYALHERARRQRAGFDLRATTASQRYGGLDAESDAVLEAARATAGEVLTFDGEPILAVFHASSGGRTASADEVWQEPRPYLRAVAVEGEDEVAPDGYWRAQVPASALARALGARGREIGTVEAVEIAERSESGRARVVRVVGSAGAATIAGSALRSALGEGLLRSTLFDVRPAARGAFLFVGSGRGHGVGLSQWGAFVMAARGAGYRSILARFYPGTRLERITRGVR